jgi:hypothetical protein
MEAVLLTNAPARMPCSLGTQTNTAPNLRANNLIAVLSAGLVACIVLSFATGSDHWPRSGVFRGTAVLGFEHSDFAPDDSHEKWWLSGAVNAVYDRMSRTQPPLQNPVYVALEGELSERGHHGHLGQYRRELRVVRVLEVKQADAGGKK